eukprot:5218108-Pleurochrysis_carterae.AAC.1
MHALRRVVCASSGSYGAVFLLAALASVASKLDPRCASGRGRSRTGGCPHSIAQQLLAET